MRTQYIFYSVIGILAILIHSVINFNQFKHSSRGDYSTGKDYRIYLVSVFCYYIIDLLWGFIALTGNTTLLYIDTLIYYIAMALSVVFWCRYVIVYLKLNNKTGEILKKFSTLFWHAVLILLFINHFRHLFFWFEEDGAYHAYPLRYATFTVQMAMFMAVAIISLVSTLKSSGSRRRRNVTIAYFSILMVFTVLAQIVFPLLPIYSMGLVLGTCILHVFVQEDERDEYRKKQKETDEVISRANMGIWTIYLYDGEAPRLKPNAKMRELLSLPEDMTDEEDIYHAWYDRIKPEALPSVNASVAAMMSGVRDENTYLWIDPVLGEQYVRCGGVAERVEGKGWILHGYHYNVNEEVRKEQKREVELAAALKETERSAVELKKALEDAQVAAKAKTDFLFNMSHDIRTPMNAIMGFSDLIAKHSDDKELVGEYIKKIQNSNDFLMSLINNVLEMARVESGKATLDETPCDSDAFCASIVSMFDLQMKEKNINFSYALNAEHRHLMVDETKLREIILNILSNAVKYTPCGGSVSMTVTELPSEKEGYDSIRQWWRITESV